MTREELQATGFVFKTEEDFKSPFIYAGNTFGVNFFTGHYVVIRENNHFGDNVRIGSYTEITHDCTIEDGVRIHSHCVICEGAILKKNCWIGPCVNLINDYYPLTGGKKRQPPVIGERAIVGVRAVIMPGVHVGNDSIVGVGSLVTGDVPDGEVWIGDSSGKHFLKKRNDLHVYPTV